jgi:phage shock protein B
MNGFVFTLIFIPLIAFVLVVLPLWIVLYYRDSSRRSRALSEDEWNEIRRTLELSEKLEQRLVTLEAILDAEHKGWREERP